MNQMAAPLFNRVTEDIGNIVHLEHVNMTQQDQRLMALFWVGCLGGTRDPYLHVLDNNMWVNFGRQQVHSPTRAPQVLRGTIGLVTPELESVRERLKMIAPRLEGTKFTWKDNGDTLEAWCPWGNHVRVHSPQAKFGTMRLGFPYVERPVPRGTAEGIVRFYTELMLTPSKLVTENGIAAAHVPMGVNQFVIYRETDAPLPEYDGHHIAIYVANFSGPHALLSERGLVFEESDQWQYRFKDLTDPKTGKFLFTLEHEVRSLSHPMYGRPLMNRNPAQQQTAYTTGHDAFY